QNIYNFGKNPWIVFVPVENSRILPFQCPIVSPKKSISYKIWVYPVSNFELLINIGKHVRDQQFTAGKLHVVFRNSKSNINQSSKGFGPRWNIFLFGAPGVDCVECRFIETEFEPFRFSCHILLRTYVR